MRRSSDKLTSCDHAHTENFRALPVKSNHEPESRLESEHGPCLNRRATPDANAKIDHVGVGVGHNTKQ